MLNVRRLTNAEKEMTKTKREKTVSELSYEICDFLYLSSFISLLQLFKKISQGRNTSWVLPQNIISEESSAKLFSWNFKTNFYTMGIRGSSLQCTYNGIKNPDLTVIFNIYFELTFTKDSKMNS